jgi:hypothetical protein
MLRVAFMLIVVLWWLPTSAAGEAQGDHDRELMQSVLLLVDSAAPTEQLQLMRRLVLYPADQALKREVCLPKLGAIVLNEENNPQLRREAAKAIVTIGGEQRMGVLINLLRQETFDFAGTVAAFRQSKEPYFIAPLLRLAAKQELEEQRRYRLITAALSLWPASDCQTYLPTPLTDLSEQHSPFDDTKPPVSHQPSAKQGKSLALLLEEINRGLGKSMRLTSEQETLGWLLLGCLGDREVAIGPLAKSFPLLEVAGRLRIARFMPELASRRAVELLGDCATTDLNREVRVQCGLSLAQIAKSPTKSLATKAYQALFKLLRNQGAASSRSVGECLQVARLIAKLPNGRRDLAVLLDEEKNNDFRAGLKNILSGKAATATDNLSPFKGAAPPDSP